MAIATNTENLSEINRRALETEFGGAPSALAILGEQLAALRVIEDRTRVEAWSLYQADKITGEECDERYDLCYEMTNGIVLQILDKQAFSLEDLKVKAAAIDWCHCGDVDFEATTTDMRMVHSIISDLLKI